MAKIKCSLPILTLNAKKSLERLLPLIVPEFDDVFLMDGNSTDGTREYAQGLGVRVVPQYETDEQNVRIKDFYEVRMRSWALAKHDWIFVIDADEGPTPELLRLIRSVVTSNQTKTVLRVRRYPELSNGTVIRHTPFYRAHFVRLFTLSSGVTLIPRKVHERFIIPPDVAVVDCEEAIICPEPSAEALRRRSARYLAIEAEQLEDTSLWYLFRWVIVYNIKSFFGQLLRVVIADIRNLIHHEPSLPWNYDAVFLEYQLRSIATRSRSWRQKRRQKNALAKLAKKASVR